MIPSASLNSAHKTISDKSSTTKPDDHSAGSFLELLNEFKSETGPNSTEDLMVSVSSLFSPMNEDHTESIDQMNHQDEQAETEQLTREDFISFIHVLINKDNDTNNPSLARLEEALQNIDPNKSRLALVEKELLKMSQQESITLEKVAKMFAEVAAPVKEGIPTSQLVEKAGEDSFKLMQNGNVPVSDFDFHRQFEGKEVIFQSFHPNGSAVAASKSEQEPLPNVSVEQFFSEVIELVKNQATLKKASEFMEAKFSLTPEKLGDIDVTLSIHKGQVTAQFMAETLIGKETLESQISLLRSSLQQQGLLVDKIEISLSGQGLQHSFSQQEDKSRQEQSQQRFSKKKINVDEIYQSHSTIEEYKQSGTENTINILA